MRALRCLAEFLKWSIKQTTKRQAADSAVNVAALMKRLTMLGRHPRAYLRLGGARAFNHLYTTFREVGLPLPLPITCCCPRNLVPNGARSGNRGS